MTDMGSRSSNIVFLVGFIVYVTIRGVFERRARIKEKMVRRLDAVEKTLLIFVGVGSLLLPVLYLFTPFARVCGLPASSFCSMVGYSADDRCALAFLSLSRRSGKKLVCHT